MLLQTGFQGLCVCVGGVIVAKLEGGSGGSKSVEKQRKVY